MKLKSFIRAFLALVTVTYTGMEYQARYTNQSTVGSWKWMAIGKGTTAEDANHTALVNECTESGMIRALAILSYESSYKSVWTVTYTNNTGSTVAVEEAGIFDQLAIGGHMLMRGLMPATYNVAAAQTLEVTMKLAQAV